MSVLFSASHSPRGAARDLVVAGVVGDVDLIISLFVVVETRRNLSLKASSALPYFEALLGRGVFRLVEPPATLVHRVAGMIVP